MIDILKGFQMGLRPVPKLLTSEWADKFRRLTSESSAEPGQWRTSRTPYLKAIMDAMSPSSPVNEVIVMKGVQLGFSESGLNTVGCFMDIAPCPIMYVMPTLDMAKSISETRLKPMIENCANLNDKVAPTRTRDAGNTTLKKSFPGGFIKLAGANSAASLRSMPVRTLILDEADAYPLNLDGEGSPVALADKRTSTYGARRKIYMLSTPTIHLTSVIEREFLNTEQRYWYVPCPSCGAMQKLEWLQLRWQPKRPETVRYHCAHCDFPIEERHKTRMLAAGDWVAEHPELQRPNRMGFHINALYSPLGWLSWSKIVSDYEDKALKDENEMRVHVNTILAETIKEKGDAPEWENIFNRREQYTVGKVPAKVAVLVAGADVQGNRIELEIVGYYEGKRSYSVDYRVLEGNTNEPEVWNKLAAVLGETWEREDGAEMGLRMLAIDSGFNTQTVYEFCRRFDQTRIVPVKGEDNQRVLIDHPKQVDVAPNGRKVGSLRLFHVGVGLAKSELYGWLRLNRSEDGSIPEGYCHFPEYGPAYFKGLTAEQLQFRLVKGYRKYFWEKTYERNEPLDCRVYARAAASIIGMDRWTDADFAAERTAYAVVERESPSSRRRSSWL